ncbi:uncharacterized protein LOC106177846 [Lingula anatina]|uniref:Uncharacterized protein LOC106177846 n=1 Tax=Lingula anatina TaxID=7574 RepID=A0A1S3K0N6_LINAN|nr:uncharacterized protein LOC106177846 [Lingula anatina]|eukprot:XP_013416205.1 uncharacterized protein LOC106177846 [Lingula anatina]
MLVDFVMRAATEEDETGVNWVNGSELTDLDFADDIVLLAKDENDLKQLTSNLEIAARKFGLRISSEKTKVMYVGARNITPINVGTEITRFTCLGSLITMNGDAEMDVKSRVGKGARVFRRMNNIWKSTSMSTQLKICLYNA